MKLQKAKNIIIKAALFFAASLVITNGLSQINKKFYKNNDHSVEDFKLFVLHKNSAKIIKFSEEKIFKNNSYSHGELKWDGHVKNEGEIHYRQIIARGKIEAELKISGDDIKEWFHYEIKEDGAIKPISSRIMHPSYMMNGFLIGFLAIYLIPSLLNMTLRNKYKSKNQSL